MYAKPPFAGPKQVLDYVGRYTHRVAISNNRLLDMEDDHVRFRWKDYADANQHKSMTLAVDEFIRRFLLHALPSGLQRIRYYGLLGNRHRTENLARCRDLLNMPVNIPPPDEPTATLDYRSRYEALTGKSLHQCPVCHEGCMQPFVQESILNHGIDRRGSFSVLRNHRKTTTSTCPLASLLLQCP